MHVWAQRLSQKSQYLLLNCVVSLKLLLILLYTGKKEEEGGKKGGREGGSEVNY